jgi:two-component system, sensor histidine kinase and response regulator
MSTSRILIVDDELSIRIMLTRMVEPLKHEVLCAEDGIMALDLVRRAGVDLVISDLMMPRMDGIGLLEAIRREGYDCAFIILTGFGDLPQALLAREKFNISNFLVKPIHNTDQFLFDVESALSHRMLERENSRLLQRQQDVNARLEDKVQARTHELKQKNEELARLSRFRADVLKVLGHELRTPLAILTGYHALASGGSAAALAELGPSMGASIRRLQEIVDKALHLLKAGEATEFPLELRDVGAPELCRRVAERLAPFIAERRLAVVSPPEPPQGLPCCWDVEKIEEVVEELLLNAIRASADGSRIEIGLAPAGEWVELNITDYGVGIPEAMRERIFEPFVTLREAQHHSSGLFEFGAEGVGIGLSTARLWVTLHGGSIAALPNPGRPGTTMRVRLPRRAVEPAGSKPAREERQGARASDPILRA